MALYELTRKTFVNGALRFPGETVDIADKVFLKPEETDEAYVKNSNAVPLRAGASPSPQPIVVIAPITVSGADASRPQGIPSGAVQSGNTFIGDGGERIVGSSPELDPNLRATLEAQTAQADAAKGASTLTAEVTAARAAYAADPGYFSDTASPEEVKTYLDAAGVEYATTSTKAKRIELAENDAKAHAPS